ncbi:hypothetical protein ACQEVZ_27880 [Dactylosporangium sp. CA-152071]|uniref:hypothetical protein n=1 Tax=Dactylosporangium sp. CA-152071 TaxID=3239933 RepID=UPI003D93C71C
MDTIDIDALAADLRAIGLACEIMDGGGGTRVLEVYAPNLIIVGPLWPDGSGGFTGEVGDLLVGLEDDDEAGFMVDEPVTTKALAQRIASTLAGERWTELCRYADETMKAIDEGQANGTLPNGIRTWAELTQHVDGERYTNTDNVPNDLRDAVTRMVTDRLTARATRRVEEA